MWWKFFNKAFGWDYVAWMNSADHGVSRVRIDGDGKPFFFRYRGLYVIDFFTDTGKRIVWLTCSSSKFLSKNPQEK